MKKLFLLTLMIPALGFAQETTKPPVKPIPCNDFIFYACDASGQEITNKYDFRYRKFTVNLCVESPEHNVVKTLPQMVQDEICETGTVSENSSVRLINIEYPEHVRILNPDFKR